MTNWRRTVLAGLLWSAGTLGGAGLSNAAELPDGRFALIPRPAELTPGDGELRLDAGTRVTLSDPASAELQRISPS